MKKLLLMPEYGHPWGLWSDTPINPTFKGEFLTPQHFNLSAELSLILSHWLEQWRNNFADAPEEDSHTWKRGFNKHDWVAQGDVLSSLLEKELPGYQILDGYSPYLNNATR